MPWALSSSICALWVAVCYGDTKCDAGADDYETCKASGSAVDRNQLDDVFAQEVLASAGCAPPGDSTVEAKERMDCLFSKLYPAVAKYGGDLHAGKREMTYGELLPGSIHSLLFYKGLFGVPASSLDRFVDLGSGTGKLPIQAFLAGLDTATGVELATDRHGFAAGALSTLQRLVPSSSMESTTKSAELSHGGRRLALMSGDLLELPLAGFSIVYSSALCFPKSLLEAIAQKLRRELAPGAVFWSLAELPGHEGLTLAGRVNVESTWSARTTVHVYIRVPDVALPVPASAARPSLDERRAWVASVVEAARRELSRLQAAAGVSAVQEGGGLGPLEEAAFVRLAAAMGAVVPQAGQRLLHAFGVQRASSLDTDRCGCAQPSDAEWLLTEAGFLEMVAHSIPQVPTGCALSGRYCNLGDLLIDEAFDAMRMLAKCRATPESRACRGGSWRSPLDTVDGNECLRSSDGMTLLMGAVQRGVNNIAAVALERAGHGTLLCLDHEGKGALHVAASSSGETLPYLLLKVAHAGAIGQRALDLRDGSGQTPLAVARNADSLQALIDAGCPREGVNTFDDLGKSPLHNAVVRGDWSLAELLLKLGANASAGGERGLSPLSAAARLASGAPFIRLLAEHRADINARLGELQTTALHQAAQRGNVDAVRALLEHGADENATASGGLRPRDLARLTEVLELLDRGAAGSA